MNYNFNSSCEGQPCRIIDVHKMRLEAALLPEVTESQGQGQGQYSKGESLVATAETPPSSG